MGTADRYVWKIIARTVESPEGLHPANTGSGKE